MLDISFHVLESGGELDVRNKITQKLDKFSSDSINYFLKFIYCAKIQSTDILFFFGLQI